MNRIEKIMSELFQNEETKDHPFTGVDVTKILEDPKNDNLFELPDGKKFWDMPISHYEDLVAKKGRVLIEGALINLRIFNANTHPDISKKAEDIRLELKNKFKW